MDEGLLPAVVSTLLLASLALAGCVDDPAKPDDGDDGGEEDGAQRPYVEGIGPDFVVLLNPIDQTDCRHVETIVEVTRAHAQGLLPDGFEPAPGPFNPDAAALAVEVRRCAAALSEPAQGPFGRAWLTVLVEPPRLPEPAATHQSENRTRPDAADETVHQYVLAAYTDAPGFERFLHQSGIPFDSAWVDLSMHATPLGTLVEAGVQDRETGADVLHAVAAVVPDTTADVHTTYWAASRHGVQAFEEHRHGDAQEPDHTGPGTCLGDPEGHFARHLEAGCAGWARSAPSFQVTGHSLWFHDVRVL